MISPAHKAHQTVSFSGCNKHITLVDLHFLHIALYFDIHLWISFTPNVAVLFVDVAIKPEVRFIAKQNLSYENREQRQSHFGPIRRIYPLLDDRFDELP
ncbi:hypothetical protein TNCV_4222011 [Trichonephila clavipes]|nr:hypothetical protein TNCV_4222011 [Trichonephila clavipes]